MAADAHKNLAISAVATAPSPATSGTSLVLTSAHGARFPDPATDGAFYATIWPTGAQPTPANAEIVKVTARSTDTLTIVRAQRGTTARTVVVGDQVALGVYAEDLQAIEARLDAQRKTAVGAGITNTGATLPGAAPISAGTQSFSINTDYYFPIHCEDALTFDQLILEVTTASGSAGSIARVGIVAATTAWQPSGSLIEDFGTVATDSTGVKTIAPSGGSRTLPAGRYLLLLSLTGAAATLRRVGASLPGAILNAAFGSNPTPSNLTASRTAAAFPSTVPNWTAAGGNNTAFYYPILLRATALG